MSVRGRIQIHNDLYVNTTKLFLTKTLTMKKPLLHWHGLFKIKKPKLLKTLILPTTTNITPLPRLITTNTNLTVQLIGNILLDPKLKFACQRETKK